MNGKTLLVIIVSAAVAAVAATFVLNLLGIPYSAGFAGAIGGATGAMIGTNQMAKKTPGNPSD